MKKFNMFFFLFLIIVFLVGAVYDVWWMYNIFGFYSWISLVLYLALFLPGGKEIVIESFIRGEHFSRTFDVIYYALIVLTLAATAHWVYAIVWVLKMMIDLGFRKLA